MNNKLVRNLASASVAAAIAVAMGSQVLAVEWYPSRTQSEVGVTQPSVSTSTGTSITVSSKPSIDPATGSAVQVESSQDVIIQVTPVSATLAANAALNATGLSAQQLSGQATSSGLSYAANGQLNSLYQKVTEAESVSGLLAATAPAAAAAFESTVGASADSYSPIALYDIAASLGAANAIAQGGSVDVAIAVPGVTDGTQMVAICWDRAGNSRIVPVRVSGGAVYLSVTTSGPVMLMARAQA
ncbi:MULTISPECIES: hypothetical protein [unclassified Faecalibacterium]|uniref:hypothetical protein n=1 Tax=unclassified Faecalibacterium TaxID=2646395 RepID=UPI000B39481E|nr:MULTISPECIES: hypothetical protein [unclassified Faecalibacterium]OUP27218.1 hypothetical protein B5F27_10755 [Faecalibacterium sp. An192]OUQ38469.1 hypothetical protein B5E67_05640 [Faecalibacterium sp. An122]